ncbi:MAG: hypothetical protein H6739_13800 [Alphaproteobacteria bacterium]|nr:hypothetical protein [Alphaproteobacteria bacterium]
MTTLLAHKGLTLGLSLLVLVLLAVGFGLHQKQVSPLSFGWYGAVARSDGLALGGFDPVRLHAGEAVRGQAGVSTEYAGASFTFASEESRAAFLADPEAALPAYGGFCAFAASKGFTAKADPEAFVVRGGRLYLFADAGIRDRWLSEGAEGAIAAADAAWAKR